MFSAYFIMIVNHPVLCHILQRPLGYGPWFPLPLASSLFFILPLQWPPWFLRQLHWVYSYPRTFALALPVIRIDSSLTCFLILFVNLLKYPLVGVLQDYPIKNNTPSSIFPGLLFFTDLSHTTLGIMLYTCWFKYWISIYWEKGLCHCVSWA